MCEELYKSNVFFLQYCFLVVEQANHFLFQKDFLFLSTEPTEFPKRVSHVRHKRDRLLGSWTATRSWQSNLAVVGIPKRNLMVQFGKFVGETSNDIHRS